MGRFKKMILHNLNLTFMETSNMGTGLLSGKSIAPGDVLFYLETNLIINYSTVLSDEEFCSRIMGKPRFIVCLAVYLLFRRNVLKSDERLLSWYEKLPQKFNLPFSWSDEFISHLPFCLRQGACEIRRQFDEDYREVRKSFSFVECSFDDFLWAFSIAHTRCLKWPVDVEKSPLLDVSGDIDYVLVPYADFINHRSDALVRTEVKNGRFHLVSCFSQKANNQVFINYGFHSNAYFLLQYGFVPPDNPHDFIEISINQILFITQYSDDDKRELIDFIEANDFSLNLFYLYRDGISTGLCKLCYIIVSEKTLWSGLLHDTSQMSSLSDDYHNSAKSLFRLTLRFNLDILLEEEKEFLQYCQKKPEEDFEPVCRFLKNWVSILTDITDKLLNENVHLPSLMKI